MFLLEERQLLSGSIAVDLLDAAPRSEWSIPGVDASLGHQVSFQPLKTSKAPPPVGGNYKGLVYNVYFEGIKQPGYNGTVSDFSVASVTLNHGKKRDTMTFTYSKYVQIGLTWDNLRDITLNGKWRTGKSFKLSGSNGGFSGAPGTTDLVVSGIASADGRRLSGSYSVVMHTMAGPEYALNTTGKFSVKRIKG
jgi:hypothetical protein